MALVTSCWRCGVVTAAPVKVIAAVVVVVVVVMVVVMVLVVVVVVALLLLLAEAVIVIVVAAAAAIISNCYTLLCFGVPLSHFNISCCIALRFIMLRDLRIEKVSEASKM